MSGDRQSYASAARGLLRDSLLDAACDLIVRRSWAELTMADVATGAGVSRQTLYNEFGTRSEFAQALVLREVHRLLTGVEDVVRANLEDPPLALCAAFDSFRAQAETNPLVREIVSEGADELLRLVTTHGAPVLQYASLRLGELMIDGWPTVDEPDARLLAEALVRLAIVSVAIPEGPAGMTGSDVRRLLGPFIAQALAEG